MKLEICLTIAGSDSSAGAGVQADLKTFTALGCYGVNALTSVVAESPTNVALIQLLDPIIVSEQIKVLAVTFPIRAAKTGMLGGRAQIEAIISAWRPLAKKSVPLVIDPVMIATTGKRLLDEDALEILTTQLFPLARVITPNLDEAAVLLGARPTTRLEMEQGALQLSVRLKTAILLKGGHLVGDDAPDVLVDGGAVVWFEGARIHGVHTHGTGCTYSAAITAGLAKQLSLEESVRRAKEFVTRAIANHHRWGAIDALNHFA